jgi:superfamily II DNA or RNA helicase
MPTNSLNSKELYAYQKKDLERIFDALDEVEEGSNLLYQLPTGGGKTVVFSEIAKRFIERRGKKVVVLTHRIELSSQTSKMLDEFGVINKVINSSVKEIEPNDPHMCYVAMVETLNNRLNDEKIVLENIGLVIIDEAHYNSFRKLFKYFERPYVLGVTATPLSSNIKLPMKDFYKKLIIGESIQSLIDKGFLAEAEVHRYDLSLQGLKLGINGDYTVKSSDAFYSNYGMLGKLLSVYNEVAKGSKTLIFNNGINASYAVYETFKRAGLPVRHLDNKHSAKERQEILMWFKKTPDAILTSVSILTTGFDEPTVETVILNRATRSLTLYFQMIGRGSRVLKNKKKFNVIDLGNNTLRFGAWNDPIDWNDIFYFPDFYLESIKSDEEIERNFEYTMPAELRSKFSKSTTVDFDIKERYKELFSIGQRPKKVLEESIEQHALMCIENSSNITEARQLMILLEDDIKNRVKQYTYCIMNTTKNYKEWLEEDYNRKLRSKLVQCYARIES